MILRNFTNCKIISEINFTFFKNITNRGLKIKSLLDWYENQSIDKGMILGCRKYSPKTYTCGYQGYIVCSKTNRHLAPTKFEKKLLLTPHCIAVVGKELLNIPTQFTFLKTFIAPGYRFSNVFKKQTLKPNNDRHVISIPGSISRDETSRILNQVLPACKNIKIERNLVVFFKPHPLHDSKFYRKQIQKEFDSILFFNGDFSELAQKSHVILGTASSALVESYAFCQNILIVGNKTGITANPFPRILHKSIFICHGKIEIEKKMRLLLSQNINHKFNSKFDIKDFS